MEFDRRQRFIYLTHEEQEVLNESAIVPYDEAGDLLDKVVGIRDGYASVNPSEQPTSAKRNDIQAMRERGLRVTNLALEQLASEVGASISRDFEKWLGTQD